MSCVVCVSIISRVDKKRERPTAAQGVGPAGGQSYMFGIYGNLPTSAILDIFHSERGQRREKKTKFPLVFCFFLPPILLFFIFFLVLSCLASFPYRQEGPAG